MLIKKLALITILLLFIAISVQAAPDYYAEDVYITTGVDSGMGGPYPTDNSGLETIFSNPAAFKSAEEELSFSNLTLQLTGPVFDIVTLVLNSVSAGSDMTTLLTSPSTQNILSGLYAGFALTGPVYFGYVGDGLGFGLFNSTEFLIRSKSALSISMNLKERVLLAGGYSFRIPLTEDESHLLDLGVMLKGGVEGAVRIEKSYLELPAMFESIGADLIMGEPFDFTTIIGLDAGIRYAWGDLLSAGISLQDVYSPTVKYTYSGGIDGFLSEGVPITENGLIPFKINAGVEFSPVIPFIDRWLTNFRIMAAYDDILDFLLHPSESQNYLLHIKTGLEITMLEILDVRVGLAQGLLNAGFGLDLQVFTLNAAMFGTELSSQPGTKPAYNLVVGFKF